MSWELVIFDCDGVLVDSEPISNRILAEMLTETGLPMDLEQCYTHFMGRSMVDCVHILTTRFAHPVADEFVAELRRRTLAALEAEVRPIPGVEPVLDSLNAPACVASSGPLVKMRTTLGRAGLLHHFDGRLFSASAPDRGKPHPDVFLHAAAAMGAEPDACAVVEDSPAGVQAGVAAGMTVFGFAALTGADRLAAVGAHVFTDMRELPALLERGPPS